MDCCVAFRVRSERRGRPRLLQMISPTAVGQDASVRPGTEDHIAGMFEAVAVPLMTGITVAGQASRDVRVPTARRAP